MKACGVGVSLRKTVDKRKEDGILLMCRSQKEISKIIKKDISMLGDEEVLFVVNIMALNMLIITMLW
jgi:hypothetical protein